MSSININITVDVSRVVNNLDRKEKELDSKLQKFLNDMVLMGESLVKQEAPKKTGRLSSATQKKIMDKEGIIFVSANIAPYFKYVIDGTRPHDIVPVKAKALFWAGARHPVKRVHHKGTKANPYVDRAAEKLNGPMQRYMNALVKWLEG